MTTHHDDRQIRCRADALEERPLDEPEPHLAHHVFVLQARSDVCQSLRQREAFDAQPERGIDGVAMRVGRGADSKTVAAVIRALKATS